MQEKRKQREIMIQKANKNHINFIIELLKETNGQPFTETALCHMLESDVYSIFIYIDKEPSAFIITWQSDIYGQIIDFAVKQDKQNKGIGKTLLKEAINNLVLKGINEISLEVRKTNEKAVYIYESFGFKYENTIPNYYKNEDGLLYRWKK